jgi:predicted dehydrogenase
MNPTRIAVAGAGYIGQAHMGVARRSAMVAVALSAIVDPSPAAVELAAKAGVPLYASLDELLAHDRPDGVVLATPNHLHVSQALQCIEVKLPVLLEKPIATTVAEASRLVDAVRLKTYRQPQDRSWWKPFDTEVIAVVRSDPIALQMEHFGQVVRGEAEPLVSANDGLLNLCVTEAIAQAARSGRTIEIETSSFSQASETIS